MAAISSNGTGGGDWSATATWAGNVVPVDGDSVSILLGDAVNFDVDQSGFGAGLAGLDIDGTLTTDDGADRYLKCNADITGSGDWYIDDGAGGDWPSNRKMPIDLGGGSNSIASTTLTPHFHCAEPVNQYVRLSALEAAGQTVLSVDTDVTADLWNAGDIIKICNIDNARDVEERIIAGGGIGANTITITAGLTAEKIQGSFIVLINRNIRVINSTDFAFKNIKNSNIGVEISNCANGYSACTGNVIYGTDGDGLYLFSANSNQNVFSGVAVVDRAIQGSWANIITGHLIGCQYGEYSTFSGGANIYSGFIAGCTAGLLGSTGSVVLGSIIGCTDGVNNSSCVDLSNATLDNLRDIRSSISIILRNTLFDGDTEFDSYINSRKTPFDYCSSIDHDQVVGAFKAWTLGGIVTSDTVTQAPGQLLSYKHACEDADNAVFKQEIILIQPGNTFLYEVDARKDAVMTWLPRAQLVDPAEDPLIDDAYTPLDEDIMTDTVAFWETLSLTYTNTTDYPMEVIVRTLAKNATNSAWFFVDGGKVIPGPTEPLPPSFDGLENDGDGDAVTLTITPPATGNYDATRIYYRIYGSGAAWTDGGTHVGTQGVQGTKQITGLDNATRYQFIIFTEYDVYYSTPSPTRSIYCTDNADNGDYINVEAQVVATLQADTGSGGLNETGAPLVNLFERGVRDAPHQYAKQDMPVIGVYCTGKNEVQDGNEETVEKDFEVAFVVITRVGKVSTGEDACKKIMARLETVIREQTSTINLWSQLPVSDLIKGAEGTLASIVKDSTPPVVQDDPQVSQGSFIVYSVVRAEIQIPVSFDL